MSGTLATNLTESPAWPTPVGEHDTSIAYYEQALASVLNTYGEGHPQFAIRCSNLGMAYHAL